MIFCSAIQRRIMDSQVNSTDFNFTTSSVKHSSRFCVHLWDLLCYKSDCESKANATFTWTFLFNILFVPLSMDARLGIGPFAWNSSTLIAIAGRGCGLYRWEPAGAVFLCNCKNWLEFPLVDAFDRVDFSWVTGMSIASDELWMNLLRDNWAERLVFTLLPPAMNFRPSPGNIMPNS